MKIGLVGWGVETQSAYRYYGPEHEYVIGSEEPRDDFPTDNNVMVHALAAKRTPGLVGNVSDLSYLDHFEDCELVIYQGAAHKNLEKKFNEDHDFWSKAKTTLDIFFEKWPREQIIGVTGTKGKGTTTTLIYRLITEAGIPAVIGGNIGIPVLDLLSSYSESSWAVLELSSFQLYKFNHSPHIAVHLMMLPEHIEEWHKTMEDYVGAKRNIFAHQSSNDIAVYLPDNQYSAANVRASIGQHIPYMHKPGAYTDESSIAIDDQHLVSLSEMGLIGKHNVQNVCAAVTAVWNIHKDTEKYHKVLSDFKGLEHRLELAGEIDGVRYYDDSFGTTPDTAIVAMDAFEEQKVMIVGGHDKGNDMTQMCRRLAQSDIKHAVFIGTIGKALYEQASNFGLASSRATFREDGNSWTMEDIVKEANLHADAGDIVLLSTGSSSFGIFNDYKDRGNQFKKCVSRLMSEHAQQ